MKRFINFLLIFVFITTFSAAQTADNTNFREEGIASWYGREFSGLRTASGDVFDPALFTAAHRTLPFGTLLTVTNTQNMRQVNVRVNDRGPFTAARIIDLSEAAAAVLDILEVGVVPVIITRTDNVALGPVTTALPTAPPAAAPPAATPSPPAAPPAVPQLTIPPPGTPAPELPSVQAAHYLPPFTPAPAELVPQSTPAPAAPAAAAPAPSIPATGTFIPAPPARVIGNIPPANSTSLYRIQVGSFRVQGNAVETFVKLREAGLNPNYEQSGEFIRVVLSGLRAQDIAQVRQSLGNAGFPEVMIRQEN